jgi:beta-xylosidase
MTKREFHLASGGHAAPLVVSDADWPGVQRAAHDLQSDIQKVSGVRPVMAAAPRGTVVIIGTLGKSPLIDRLVHDAKVDTTGITGRWETYVRQVIDHPMHGVDRALVIAGSDKRGTIYGIYDLSQLIGVSPWYWWADVPVPHASTLTIDGARFSPGEPRVRYRGIFINDEAPAFSRWAREKFGGINHLVYEHVFELILRLRGNYLWPAMWGNAFADDDSLNARLADEYGIVMGTSHHEPMTRAQQEWKRYGKGPWNYEENDSTLRAFWRGGIERMGTRENIVTIGMRGDGDVPMTQSRTLGNIALLERIVADQRRIIAEVTHKPASATPQVWALYKEVQDYYDRGMRVPDDVTLLFSDDNWGNIRRLPSAQDRARSGGSGIYYHFDYVGGPRNYKWINTNPIARVWEQMDMAYRAGADRIWVVNVGDLKPMEFPIQFFLDFAWNPDAIPAASLPDYTRRWAERQFGAAHGAEIGDFITTYLRYAGRRKPELLDTTTYSLDNYDEADRVVADYDTLAARAQALEDSLPPQYHDAYFELVLHPILAAANLNALYVTVARNHQYARQGRAAASMLAARARELFRKDSALSNYFNTQLAGGKWDHMMDQTHIGYTSWQEPPHNVMPRVDPAARRLGDSAPTDTPHRRVAESPSRYISIEAEHYTSAVQEPPVSWLRIPNFGRTLSGMTTVPSTAPGELVGARSPRLEYQVVMRDSGTVHVQAYLAPSLNVFGSPTGLRYAVSFDDDTPQVVNVLADSSNRAWEHAVAANIRVSSTSHRLTRAGTHTLKFWRVDPGVVLEKLVIDAGDVKPSYLGPPESARPAHAAPTTARFDWFEYAGDDSIYHRVRATRGQYLNPILAGFYPDPSIVRVGDDYFLVTSSFSYFPGIPIFRSRDLVHWTQIGNVLDRPTQLAVDGRGISEGIYAPAIRYHDGTFYLITTCSYCGGNFIVTATNPAGPWSEPVWLGFDGIDPSLFFDDDGRAYIVNNGPPPEPPRYSGHRAIWMQEYDMRSHTMAGARHVIVDGGVDTSTHPIWIEAPHILKVDGRYYLICAEGGTAGWHSEVVFRSDSVNGPYRPAPHNPILTQRRLASTRPAPITSTGHADFVETPRGEWWAVFLGVRPYGPDLTNIGRETFMLPVTWRNGWPIILDDSATVPYVHAAPRLPADASGPTPMSGNFVVRDEFDGPALAPSWELIRTPRESWYDLTTTPGSLTIRARSIALGQRAQPSFIGRRQQHAIATASTAMRFTPRVAGDAAGLVAFQSDSFYYALLETQRDGKPLVRLVRRAGSRDRGAEVTVAEASLPARRDDTLYLRIAARGAVYDFAYALRPNAWQSLASGVDGTILSTHVAGGFVGTMLGMYAYSPAQ